MLHIQHKQIAVIEPKVVSGGGGKLRIAIVPSPLGAIALDEVKDATGVIAWCPTAGTNAATTFAAYRNVRLNQPPGWGAITSINNPPEPINGPDAFIDQRYPVIPYEEWVRGGAPWTPISGGGQGANFQPSAFRVTRQIWRLSYTGAALYAQGEVAVCQQYVQTEKTLPSESTDGAGNYTLVGAPQSCDLEILTAGSVPNSFAEVAIAPQAKTWAIQPRFSVGGVKLPNETKFHAWKEMTVPAVATGSLVVQNGTRYNVAPTFAQLVKAVGSDKNEAYVAGPMPGLGSLPVTYIAAENLTTAGDVGGQAGFILEVFTDVEYQLMPTSPVRRFTAPPVSENSAALKVIAETAKQTPPAVEAPTSGGIASALGNALGWYANTMKDIVGTVWGTGGQVLQEIGLFPKFGKTMQGLGNIVQGTGRLAITG